MRYICGAIVGLAFLSKLAAGLVAADIDQDETVNIVDVQLVINGALRLADPSSADIDFNESPNGIDIQLPINAVLGIDIDVDDDGLADSPAPVSQQLAACVITNGGAGTPHHRSPNRPSPYPPTIPSSSPATHHLPQNPPPREYSPQKEPSRMPRHRCAPANSPLPNLLFAPNNSPARAT